MLRRCIEAPLVCGSGGKKMFAIIETGGKQYRVEQNTVLDIEKLPEQTGETVNLDRVLLIADGETINTGKPYVEGASVSATVLSHFRGKKIRVFKMKPKKRYRRLQGHRQHYTRIRIDDIVNQ
jgi:large subunit ribosomal protein L21